MSSTSYKFATHHDVLVAFQQILLPKLICSEIFSPFSVLRVHRSKTLDPQPDYDGSEETSFRIRKFLWVSRGGVGGMGESEVGQQQPMFFFFCSAQQSHLYTYSFSWTRNLKNSSLNMFSVKGYTTSNARTQCIHPRGCLQLFPRNYGENLFLPRLSFFFHRQRQRKLFYALPVWSIN